MQSLVTKGIVLGRTNFGEADRILTVLTPDYGKLSLMARGVRKSRSKLAGGVELFSISQITFIRGRGEVSTLISSRLETHFAGIVTDLARVQLGYDMLKLIDKNTEDEVEAGYFDLLKSSLAALADAGSPLALVRLYFEANLLALAGHAPNLATEAGGAALNADEKYNFSASDGLVASGNGNFGASEIKFLRLVFSGNSAKALARVAATDRLVAASQALVTSMMRQHLRVSP